MDAPDEIVGVGVAVLFGAAAEATGVAAALVATAIPLRLGVMLGVLEGVPESLPVALGEASVVGDAEKLHCWGVQATRALAWA